MGPGDTPGLRPGSKVDVSAYGAGLQVTPGGRSARLVQEDGRLVIAGDFDIDDHAMYAMIDAGRR
ncbi:MAG: hypothetical protein LBG60_13865 [Bifidobacteriaceae bacterium]|nr:hypothetical protein [Bifidobacteriaceae bacterium]